MDKIEQYINKKIYIIEDDAEYSNLFTLLLKTIGIENPLVFNDGLKGLMECFENPPDLLVLDLMLPNVPGEEILRLLRTSEKHRFISIMVVTATPEEKIREFDILRLGADIYLKKPFIPTDFLNNIKRLLNALKFSPVSEETRQTETAISDTNKIAKPKSDEVLQKEYESPSKKFITEVLEKELKQSPYKDKSKKTITSKQDKDFFAPSSDSTKKSISQEDTETFTGSKAEVTPNSKLYNGETITKSLEEIQLEKLHKGYNILDVIGSGGMGTVYRAEQVKLNRIVALKVLLSRYNEGTEVRERFNREALIMATVNHPNIVQVYEVGNTEYSLFFSMEYVEGKSLADHIRKGTLDLNDYMGIMLQVCNAIIHLHSKNIIHRDIKPSNILIRTDSIVKITDFGISRARLMSDNKDYTQVYNFIGTPEYMAPELFQMLPANEKTDIFALGMTFWKMFAGYDAPNVGAPLKKLFPDFPKEISDIVNRCLQLLPNNRYNSVTELREDLVNTFKKINPDFWDSYIRTL